MTKAALYYTSSPRKTVRTLAGLSLTPGHQRGHGALYDPVSHGRIVIGGCAGRRPGCRCRPGPTGRSGWGGRDQLAAAVLGDQPGAAVLPCLRAGQGPGADDPGLAVLRRGGPEPGRTCWTTVLDAVRLGPAYDETEVTAVQVRDVACWLIQAGHWRDGDPAILVGFDAGYDVTRLAWLLADLPVEVLGWTTTATCQSSREP